MIQTLAKKLEKSGIDGMDKAFGTIIIDECHHVPAKTYLDTIEKLNTYYLYGLTATPFRKYNDGKLIFINIGRIISEVKPQEIKNYKVPTIVIRNTLLDVPYNSRTDQFEVISKILIHDSNRNGLILKDVVEELNSGKKAFYRYSEKEFSINNSPLNDIEAEQLRNTISVLQRFEGSPQFEWIREIGPMLDSQFGLSDSGKIMSYDTNIDYTGYEYITQIFNAILNKRVLEVDYEPFNKPAFILEFHPYYLKQYNNRWFAFGLNKMLGIEKWNLALDRIQHIEEVDVDYVNSDINWEDHFYDIIGVTTLEKAVVEEVELIFSAEQANYIKTKPLHPTQKTYLQDNGDLLVKIKVIPNYELEMKLLSFADKVKVL